jgi:transposase-like protein
LGVRTPAELEQLLQDLKRALTERILRAELTEHLGYGEGEPRPSAVPMPATAPPRKRW